MASPFVRRPAVAGRFYPGDADDLRAEARSYLESSLDKPIRAILGAFYQDLAAHNRAGNTVTMTWSEFGRRAAENASQGTDHGSAA